MQDHTISQLDTDEITALAVMIVGTRSRISAPPWNRHDVISVIRSMAHETVHVVQHAGLAAANDPRAELPVTITWTKYRPKPADTEPEPDRGPKCDICGRSQRMCLEVRAKEERHGVPDPHDFAPVDLDRYRRGPVRPAHA